MPDDKKEGIFEITRSDQYRTIEELFERSQAGSIYYTFLIISIFIVAPGLLLGNIAIIIGGMLVTPILTPILAISLGLVARRPEAIKSVLVLLVKSSVLVIAASFMMAVIFGFSGQKLIFENTAQTAILYFVVAFASGMAATFAWTRKELTDILPGVAIAISLVPPLSLTGIWLSIIDFYTTRFYFSLFIFNLFGIILGSFIVFSLLKFYRTGKKVEAESKEAEKDQNSE